MASIFLFGTLCHPPLFEIVAGEPLRGRPARLPGHAVVTVAGEAYPMLVPGAGAEGLLVDMGEVALARITFYEACFGYHPEPVDVETDEGAVLAQCWRPEATPGAPGTAWSLEDWARDWGALSTLAAEEVMRRVGQDTPAEIAHRFGMIRSRAQSFLRSGQWRRPGAVGHGFTRADVRIEETRHPYTKFFTVEETRARFRRFGGGWSEPVERAMFRVADAVTVLPYDPRRDRILLVEQARFGVLAQGDAAPWLLEPVAGMIDAGEAPEDAARRETEEEAGLQLGALHFVSRYYPSPGGIAQVLFSYVAEADLPDEITGIGGEAKENEDILSHLVAFDEAVALLEGGDMANAPLILSFQWLMLNRARLRSSA